MHPAFALTLVALISYLIGAIPFGYLVARRRGVDLFQAGSGNIGATNVGRVLGRRFGILVFVLDFLKGAIPAAVASALFAEHDANLAGVLAGVGAFLGHLFPVYLRFRGGKGVATGAGVVVVLLPLPAVGALLTWVTVVAAFRYVSLASILASVTLCVVHLAQSREPWGEELILTSFCFFAGAAVLLRHQSNLRRLLRGTENQLKDTPAMFTLSKTLHVLAVGLWFGMAIFFSFVVAFSLFGSFERLALDEDRPLWFQLPPEYRGKPPSQKFPDPLRKEQGTRAAGFAIGPLFDWYFILQTVCAVIALATAAGWSLKRFPQRVHKLRTLMLAVALLLILAGWLLERKVSDLGGPRDSKTVAVLKHQSPPDDLIKEAEQARATFGMWHGISLLVNLIALLIITVIMALAARMPEMAPGTPAMPTPAA